MKGHTYNPSTWRPESEDYRGYFELHSKFEQSKLCSETLYQNFKKKEIKNF